MKKIRRISLLFIFLIGSISAEDDIKILMEATPNPANINSQIVLSIEISGSSRNLPDVPNPDLSEFRILAGPSTSTSINIINFKTQVSKTLTYYLFPKKTGKIKIKSIKVKYKGKEYSGNPITITVLKGSQTIAKNENDVEKDVYIQTNISTKSSYMYQQLIVTYKLYVRGRAESANIIESPDYSGFWTENFPKSNRPYQEMVGNKRYTVYDLEKKAIFPLREGELIIQPYKLQVVMLKKSKRSQDPFDVFGDMGFFNRPKEEKILVSDELKVKVNLLPNSPKSYKEGLVGKYTLKANKTNFTGKVNDAITLKFTLSGNGYLKSIKQLSLNLPEEFEQYDPKIKDNYSYSGEELYGSKTFEYILIPRKKGKFSIPENKISYFDPTVKKYIPLKIPSLSFNIEKGSKKVYTNMMNENVGIELDKDIRFIKEKYHKLYMQRILFYKNKLYWSLWIFLIILWGVYFRYRSYHRKITQDTSFYRQKKAVKQARKRLKDSIKAKDDGKFDIFLEALFKAVTGLIADKSNKSSSGMTIKEVLTILTSRKIEKENIEEVEKLLQTVEFYRFSSVENKQETMNELIDKTTEIIIKLQKLL